MKFCFNDLLMALSCALDCVEHDLVGVSTNHSKRVAYLCIRMGKLMKLSEKELSDLAGLALLHDNALTEYVQSEYLSKSTDEKAAKLGLHCSFGERNIKTFPFFGETCNAILYHHENADGSGPFGKREEEIPLLARIIHITDYIDAEFDLKHISEEKYCSMIDTVEKNKKILFTDLEADLFRDAADYEEIKKLETAEIDELICQQIPRFMQEYTSSQLMEISALFARIIDYKSTFTSNHSVGIAEKAYRMGEFYGWDEEEKTKFYLAGSMHDIGKLAVDINILEKPGRLTDEEYTQIKRHAKVSFDILSSVEGFEEIASWAALHHEKLNGLGYPFGYSEKQLGFHERLMACLDIYQALAEDRPYKKGMFHSEIMDILYQMADRKELDGRILKDLDQVFI